MSLITCFNVKMMPKAIDSEILLHGESKAIHHAFSFFLPFSASVLQLDWIIRFVILMSSFSTSLSHGTCRNELAGSKVVCFATLFLQKKAIFPTSTLSVPCWTLSKSCRL